MAEQRAESQTQDEAEVRIPFVLDGREVSASPGELLISAAERAGTFIPRFCYHPRMKSVGVCRMCLVEVNGPRGATLQPSCFIEVTEGMEVDTLSDKVRKAQDGVLEFLLVNHPLDCPVCDKGGECPLQDQTLAYGPGESRFVEEKRHFEKPIAIAELVLLDRERCIQCSQCTRFAEEVAGEALIDFAGRGEQVEVATFPGEPFSSYFSGNTVQICPVGALTATPYRFTARPWDLDQVESTCTTCALGCRVAVQSSSNRLTRLLGIDSEPVNHGWLCDKGRFAFEAVNGDEIDASLGVAVDLKGAGQFQGEVKESGEFTGRLVEPMVRKAGELVPASWGEALVAAAEGLKAARSKGGSEAVAVLGGARLTNEGAYAWVKLAKGLLGTDSVDAQLGDGLPAEFVLSLPRATIDQTCHAKAVVLLTGDVREELPVLFLRLREAAVENTTTLVELTLQPSSLTRYAAASLTARPGDAPTLARALTGDAAAAASLQGHPEGAAFSPADLDQARAVLAECGDGDGVVIVLGRPSMAEEGSITAEAARVLATAWPKARFLPALRRGNIHGALDMGMTPGMLPGRVTLDAGREWFANAWGTAPAGRGRNATAILASLAGDAIPQSDRGAASEQAKATAVVLVGSDPLSDYPDQQLAQRALEGADFVIAVTGHPSLSVDLADVVLPASIDHERPGTTTNIEGRVSRLGQKLVSPGFAWPDWMIVAELADAMGLDFGVTSLGELWEEIEHLAPTYAGVTQEILDSDAAHDGTLVPLELDGRARAKARAIDPIDPVALPGIESVERQGAPPRVGLAESPSAEEFGSLRRENFAAPGSPPPLAAGGNLPGTEISTRVPSPDRYALRIVSGRRLYDAGSVVTGSPSLAGLTPTLVARANPRDLDRLGVGTGDDVKVRTPRGELVLPAFADNGIPPGVLSLDFNVPAGDDGAANAVAALIDATALINDARVESV